MDTIPLTTPTQESDSWIHIPSPSDLNLHSEQPRILPRIIIHGGAGNITRANLPPSAYEAYKTSLLKILSSSHALLQDPQAKALDVAVHAVSLLEDDPLFNAGKGAVFTREGKNELEASIMVTNPWNSGSYIKRATSCSLLRHVRNPIKLAREMLIRGDEVDGGGAQGHCQLSGEFVEHLAEEWGLEIVDSGYFFTQRRWDEHVRGLFREGEKQQSFDRGTTALALTSSTETMSIGTASWSPHEYLPQGTVGAVVLDSHGTLCVATSTGGLTNKLPGRIGDTPTIGAGFWAETWEKSETKDPSTAASVLASLLPVTAMSTFDRVRDLTTPLIRKSSQQDAPLREKTKFHHAVAMSGTGNGDSFLRTNAVRTAGAISRFSSHPPVSLEEAVKRIAGPDGELQKSAGDRWGRTGEGEGGIIGIEVVVGGDADGGEGQSRVVAEFNCGGMFRAWVDDEGGRRVMVFREEFY